MKPVELNEYCPCCGFDTFDRNNRGQHDICPICFWEDDPVQFEMPNMLGGSNKVSLITGQNNFEEFGACESTVISKVRKANTLDKKNPKWE